MGQPLELSQSENRLASQSAQAQTVEEQINAVAVQQGYCGCDVICFDSAFRVTFMKDEDPSFTYSTCVAPPSGCRTRASFDCSEDTEQTF